MRAPSTPIITNDSLVVANDRWLNNRCRASDVNKSLDFPWKRLGAITTGQTTDAEPLVQRISRRRRRLTVQLLRSRDGNAVKESFLVRFSFVGEQVSEEE